MFRTPLALTLFIFICGCGKPDPAVHPVSGTVKMSDGTSAAGCTVEFSSEAPETKGLNARGEVQADGSFKLMTTINGKDKEGAVAGKHKVVVVPPSASSSGGPPPPAVPARYAEYNNSGLTFEVKPGENNTYPITIETK